MLRKQKNIRNNKFLRKEKAITLIALVVTIIVLLLLAGISISMLAGNNSILQRAGEAKEEWGKEEEKDQLALAYNAVVTNKSSNGDFSPVKASELNAQFEAENVEAMATEDNPIKVIYTKSKRQYKINNGKIEHTGFVVSGLYNENDELIKTWQELKEEGIIHVNSGVLTTNFELDTNTGTEENSSAIELVGKLVIDEEVTSLGEAAFGICTNLSSITMLNSVTSIGKGAFADCTSLTSITIPNGVTSIGKGAFADCTSLTSVTIPTSVTSIAEEAFYECTNLSKITIPNSVTSIGAYAFVFCPSLTSVKGGTAAIEYFGGNINQHIITEFIINEGVTSIAEEAFKGCTNLSKITIPNSVTSIGNGAFTNTKITYIEVPESITDISSAPWMGEYQYSISSENHYDVKVKWNNNYYYFMYYK